MIRAGVIGWPIGHSRSPLIHNHWIRKHGIDGVYDKTAVAPDDLKAFLDSLRHGERVGANVTLPHKEAAVAWIDEPDDRVRRIGALNTVWRKKGQLHATSTDGPGFLASLEQTLPGVAIEGTRVVILGAGGSVRAIVDELLRKEVEVITLWNRTSARAEAVARHFGPRVRAADTIALGAAMQSADWFINTTSAGLKGEAGLEVPWAQLRPGAAVADIVYTPLVTPFLRAAESRGHSIVPGLGMLLHQAVVGFEKWFGVRPEVTQDLYDLVARDVDPDAAP